MMVEVLESLAVSAFERLGFHFFPTISLAHIPIRCKGAQGKVGCSDVWCPKPHEAFIKVLSVMS